MMGSLLLKSKRKRGKREVEQKIRYNNKGMKGIYLKYNAENKGHGV